MFAKRSAIEQEYGRDNDVWKMVIERTKNIKKQSNLLLSSAYLLRQSIFLYEASLLVFILSGIFTALTFLSPALSPVALGLMVLGILILAIAILRALTELVQSLKPCESEFAQVSFMCDLLSKADYKMNEIQTLTETKIA